jgi:hypothetical protein
MDDVGVLNLDVFGIEVLKRDCYLSQCIRVGNLLPTRCRHEVVRRRWVRAEKCLNKMKRGGVDGLAFRIADVTVFATRESGKPFRTARGAKAHSQEKQSWCFEGAPDVHEDILYFQLSTG